MIMAALYMEQPENPISENSKLSIAFTTAIESLYIEANKPSLSLRRYKLALQYYIKLISCPQNSLLLKCPHIHIAFLKFTSCDNQVLVGCIPIAAVAVHLKLKS